jgi:hypothetical protein
VAWKNKEGTKLGVKTEAELSVPVYHLWTVSCWPSLSLFVGHITFHLSEGNSWVWLIWKLFLLLSPKCISLNEWVDHSSNCLLDYSFFQLDTLRQLLGFQVHVGNALPIGSVLWLSSSHICSWCLPEYLMGSSRVYQSGKARLCSETNIF